MVRARVSRGGGGWGGGGGGGGCSKFRALEGLTFTAHRVNGGQAVSGTQIQPRWITSLALRRRKTTRVQDLGLRAPSCVRWWNYVGSSGLGCRV